jgi:hypothetical protein
MSEKKKVFDAKIEELMQLAIKQPLGDSNIVGLGAMWLAAELYYLQEAQDMEQRKKDREDESTQGNGNVHLG